MVWRAAEFTSVELVRVASPDETSLRDKVEKDELIVCRSSSVYDMVPTWRRLVCGSSCNWEQEIKDFGKNDFEMQLHAPPGTPKRVLTPSCFKRSKMYDPTAISVMMVAE
jgi:hypothetical protein